MRVQMDGLVFQKDAHGGIARLYRELAPRLCDLDPQLRIALITDGPLRGALPRHERITHHPLPAVRRLLRPQGWLRKLLFPMRRAASQLWQATRGLWLEDLPRAIWHSTFYTLPPRRTGPQVLTVYDMIPERFPELFNDPLDEVGRRQKQRCIQSADAIICISDWVRRALIAHYNPPEHKLHVIHLAAGTAFIAPGNCAPRPDDGQTEPYLLYVGGRAHYKNVDRLLRAYAAWPRRDRVRLVFVGAPFDADEQARLRSLEIEGHVTQQSADDAALAQLYCNAAALAYPSLDEGFGLPVIEALAGGCPVVAANIPVMHEIAGDAPFYFDPLDVDACCAALEQAWCEGRAGQRVQRGLRQAQRYSWEQTAALTLEVYRRVVTGWESSSA